MALLISFEIKATESFSGVADRLPEQQYRDMVVELQYLATTLAEKYGMDLEVTKSFKQYSALVIKRS